jgi:hypothetical protein
VEPYIGKYFSTNYARKHILKQSEEEIKQIDIENGAEQSLMDIQQMQADQMMLPQQAQQ